MIYTSYFAKMKKYPNMEFFSIARFTPKGIHIPTIQDLVPEKILSENLKQKELLKMNIVEFIFNN